MLSIWLFTDVHLVNRIVADRTFVKNKPAFMDIYNNITSKLYSYVIVDNKANTPSRRQVIT